MKFSQLTTELQEEIAMGAFGKAQLTPAQVIQLEDMTEIKLWEIIVVRLKPHAMHYAHTSIFTFADTDLTTIPLEELESAYCLIKMEIMRRSK